LHDPEPGFGAEIEGRWPGSIRYSGGRVMEEKVNVLADLFRETGRAHHQAFQATDGADPDWPIWYADYLIGKLPEHLGVRLTKSDLVYLLVRLHHEQAAEAPGSDWTRYYARMLALRYS
jgi:hypothetical protein